jgi:hypothetical protein
VGVEMDVQRSLLFNNNIIDYNVNSVPLLDTIYTNSEISQKMALCGKQHFVMVCSNDGYTTHLASYCNLRKICPACARRYSSDLFFKYFPLILPGDGEKLRFLTLTFPNVRELTPRVYLGLKSNFLKLRDSLSKEKGKRKNKMLKYISSVETTFNSKDKTFHVHLHVLFIGRYVNYSRVRDLWNSYYGLNTVSNIQLVRNPKQGIKYVLKYVTKGADLPCDFLIPYYYATKGQRLFITYGLKSSKVSKRFHICPLCGSKLSCVIEVLRSGRRIPEQYYGEPTLRKPSPEICDFFFQLNYWVQNATMQA